MDNVCVMKSRVDDSEEGAVGFLIAAISKSSK